ncbi:unnamed protein product, partial [Pylaiella littoralis]
LLATTVRQRHATRQEKGRPSARSSHRLFIFSGFIFSEFNTHPGWRDKVTLDSSAVLRAASLVYRTGKGVLEFTAFAGRCARILAPAHSVLHRGHH